MATKIDLAALIFACQSIGSLPDRVGSAILSCKVYHELSRETFPAFHGIANCAH